MVHAVKLTYKLGFGFLNQRQEARCHSAVELGYLTGSVLFTIGTVYFFPLEGMEDFVLGCRYYEVGSVVFAVLTAYSELDRYHARKNGKTERVVTIRELLEEFMYCSGSVVFLVGTFMFDPDFVEGISWMFGSPRSHVENGAAVMFMVGSFLFSLGSYVNALSIFEAPRMFRKILMGVTTSYMFGGLFFIAGTMGYVEAFEPNKMMKWVSTWFYMIGCFFYVAGSLMAFVSTVARQQVHWERIQNREKKKQMKLTRIVGKAGSALRAVTHTKRKQRRTEQPDEDTTPSDANGVHLEQALPEDDLADLDLEAESLEELAEAMREGQEGSDENIFGAFWRSVTGAAPVEEGPQVTTFDDSPSPWVGNDVSPKAGASGSSHLRSAASNGTAQTERDNVSFLEA